MKKPKDKRTAFVVLPLPQNAEKETKRNVNELGGIMDLLSLLIARTLRSPFAERTEAMEKRPQPEAELPAINFALLSQGRRETERPQKSRPGFAGRPVTAVS